MVVVALPSPRSVASAFEGSLPVVVSGGTGKHIVSSQQVTLSGRVVLSTVDRAADKSDR